MRMFAPAAILLAVTAAAGVVPPEKIPSARCLSCHDDQRASSHPVGVKVEPQRDAELLLVNGRVECTTCHVSHDVETRNEARLRFSGEQYCRSCHVLE